MKILSVLLAMMTFCLGYAETPKEGFIKANNAELFYRIFGQGEPIIVIHGGPGLSQDYLLPEMAKLAENNLVIFYDQRGSGLSTGEINSDSMQIGIFLDDLEAVRKFFGYKSVTILGHSWGGFLAMHYAIRHPESIHKLILLNSVPGSAEEYSLFEQEYMKRLNPNLDELTAIKESKEFIEGNPATVEKYYRIIFEGAFYNSEKIHLLNLCMSSQASINLSKVNEVFEQTVFSKPFNLHDQLKQVRIPTLIVHGDYDTIPPSTALKLHESIQASKYILIKNCGHFPYIETPDELFMHLNHFLKAN